MYHNRIEATSSLPLLSSERNSINVAYWLLPAYQLIQNNVLINEAQCKYDTRFKLFIYFPSMQMKTTRQFRARALLLLLCCGLWLRFINNAIISLQLPINIMRAWKAITMPFAVMCILQFFFRFFQVSGNYVAFNCSRWASKVIPFLFHFFFVSLTCNSMGSKVGKYQTATISRLLIQLND